MLAIFRLDNSSELFRMSLFLFAFLCVKKLLTDPIKNWLLGYGR